MKNVHLLFYIFSFSISAGVIQESTKTFVLSPIALFQIAILSWTRANIGQVKEKKMQTIKQWSNETILWFYDLPIISQQIRDLTSCTVASPISQLTVSSLLSWFRERERDPLTMLKRCALGEHAMPRRNSSSRNENSVCCFGENMDVVSYQDEEGWQWINLHAACVPQQLLHFS